MTDNPRTAAVGDSGDARTAETDLNGARTAVGVPHPENRPEGQSIPAADLSGFELDDYDDDKQRPPLANELPPEQDAGESFRGIVDSGEPSPSDHVQRDALNNPDRAPLSTPTVDNQTNQPDRFHNREPKGSAG
jgi:hypothetical protein